MSQKSEDALDQAEDAYQDSAAPSVAGATTDRGAGVPPHRLVIDHRDIRRGSGKTQRRRGSDYYDTILWRVMPKELSASPGFSIGLTGCDRQAGVSTVAANLAIRAADHRLSPVLLVDANLANPRLDRTFRLHDAPGMTEVLAEECSLNDAIHDSGIEGLSIMPLGAKSLVDRTRVDQESLSALLAELRGEFATIVFDLPEVRELRHSLLIAQQMDAALVVLKSEATRRKAAQAMVGRLAEDGVNVVGTVLTQQKNYIPRWFQRWL
ncbi:MAG: CpsD/CapB family tyrosine-protein kinase [Planctomycetota bacterium]